MIRDHENPLLRLTQWEEGLQAKQVSSDIVGMQRCNVYSINCSCNSVQLIRKKYL